MGEILNRIRVLQVVRAVQGGMREHVRLLVEKLDKKTYYPLVACPDIDGLATIFKSTGAEVLPIPLAEGIHPLADIKTFGKLLSVMKNRSIHLVHAHGAKASLISSIAARCAGVPLMVQTRHNLLQGTRPKWQQALYLGAVKYEKRNIDAYIAVSKALTKEINYWQGIENEKIHLIYNGIDLKKFSTFIECHKKREELGIPDGPLVGVVSRMIPEKGIDLFLQAAVKIRELVPQVQFLIVGDGPQRIELEEQACRLKLKPPPIFTGYRSDVPELLRLLQVYVVPSRNEGLSVGVLEAMASRRPVVAFAVGGIPEIVCHNKTGVLVPPNDPCSLAIAVVEVLTRPTWARKLGEKARAAVEQYYGIDSMIQQTEECYYRLLKSVEVGIKHNSEAIGR